MKGGFRGVHPYRIYWAKTSAVGNPTDYRETDKPGAEIWGCGMRWHEADSKVPITGGTSVSSRNRIPRKPTKDMNFAWGRRYIAGLIQEKKQFPLLARRKTSRCPPPDLELLCRGYSYLKILGSLIFSSPPGGRILLSSWQKGEVLSGWKECVTRGRRGLFWRGYGVIKLWHGQRSRGSSPKSSKSESLSHNPKVGLSGEIVEQKKKAKGRSQTAGRGNARGGK